MEVRVDPRSPAPLFEQIAFAIKGSVARGELRAGDRLPSVRELARELAVNPNTVIRAYEGLEHEGVIVRRQGAGCFVTGETSPLAETERLRQLDDLMRRAVTEAFHFGFRPDDIRRSLARALEGIRFPRNPR